MVIVSVALSIKRENDRDQYRLNETRKLRQELAKAKSDADRWSPLIEIAKDDVNRGKISEAKSYATRVLNIASKMSAKGYGDYSVAIHDGNMVLGRVALKEHRLEDAKTFLLKSGLNAGAPTLGSFGPNMSLANDLLAVGERETVLKYFSECRVFWTMEGNPLDSWEWMVKMGGTPDFHANLLY
jgi:hypothetical protein